MHEITVCPECQRRLELPIEHLGKQVICPQCSTAFVAGTSAPTAPAPNPPDSVIAAPSSSAPPNPLESPDLPSETAATGPSGADAQPARESRKRRGPRPDAPAPKKTGRVLWLMPLLAGALLLGVFLVVCFSGDIANVAQWGQAVLNDDVVDPPPANAQEQRQQMQAFFDRFSKAIRSRNQAKVARCFDGKRALDQLFEQNQLPGRLRADFDKFRNAMLQGFARTAIQGEIHWGNFEIRHIKALENQDLVVVTRHRPAQLEGAVRFRWWLSQQQGVWRIYDWEDMDMGLRVSELLAALFERGVENLDQNIVNDANALKDAAQVLVQPQPNIDEADRCLDRVNVRRLPKKLAAAVHMIRSVIRIRQNRFEDALASCDEAVRDHPDMPGVELLRAIANNQLFRHEVAFKHAKNYHDLLGDDADVCFQIGYALHELRRFAEAMPYYRKVLDEEPNNLDVFERFLNCIKPGILHPDVADRFLKLDQPQAHFERLARNRWKQFDAKTLEQLAQAMLKLQPQHADAFCYTALAQAESERIDPALTSFRTALRSQADAVRRQQYYADFADALAFRDKALQTYPELPDPLLGFRSLASALRTSNKLDDLQELVEMHAKQHADDPFVELYQAEQDLHDRKYERANKAYTVAFMKINDPGLLEPFRANRVQARYHSGDVLGAYREIAPPGLTFQQLANLCWQDKKDDEMQALVQAHAKNDPDDSLLTQFQWRVKIRQGRLDEAAAIFKAGLDKRLKNDPNLQVRDDFFIDMIDERCAAEAYRLAPDPAHAYEFIAGDLLGLNQLRELQAVSDAHRKNFPNDPLLSIHAGQVAFLHRDWTKAAKEFAQGWTQLPDAKRQRWSYSYLFSRYKTGQAMAAYHDTGRRRETFRQLTQMILADKKIDLFEQLLEAHRPHRAQDAEFACYEARLKILRGDPATAAAIFQRCWSNLPEQDRRRVAAEFLGDLTLCDKGVEAYCCVPDKLVAFQTLAWRYRNPQHLKAFDHLVREHTNHHPADPQLLIERAELHLLRGETHVAEPLFLLAKQQADAVAASAGRIGLMRCRIRLGKIGQTYQEVGPGTRTFQDLANQCVAERNPDQLATLLAAHRQAFPKFKHVAPWEVEIRWQKKDYEGTVRSIRAQRATLLEHPTWRWKNEDYLVRSLVRLKNFKEALREAEFFNQRKNGPQLLQVLSLAAVGDVARVMAFLDQMQPQTYFIEDCYRDEDLGPLLRSDAFRAFRERYPEPPAQGPNFNPLDWDD